MAISSRNIFDYDSTLSKKKQLDSREFRIRMKERDLISEALMRRSSAPNEQQAALIRSQRFFELGFEEGFKRAQSGETEVPDLGGLFSLFAGALFRGNMRAEGGPVKRGEPYIVGEKGPELIQPSEDGVVIPNDKLDSISQDVNRSRIKSVVQPIVQTIAQPVPSPFPVSIGVPVVKKMSASKLPNNIAKLIK